jgi:hypothetical protein
MTATSCSALLYKEFSDTLNSYIGEPFKEFVKYNGTPATYSSDFDGGYIYEYHHYYGVSGVSSTNFTINDRLNTNPIHGSIDTYTPVVGIKITYIHVDKDGVIYFWRYKG